MTSGIPAPSAFIRVRDVKKVFALADLGSGPVSLLEALRAGQRETTHREVRALSDVTFDIVEGERVGIIGRNGAGKTTLLSLLGGITTPTSGTIETCGDVHAMLTVGAVLREDLTGRENIRLDGTVHGKSQEHIDHHIAEVVAFADLRDFIDRPVRTYSTGMKGRLAFAMGAFIDPDILIIDETLSVGDAFFADKAMRRMKEMTAQGRIVILVSHSLSSIDEMCDRCIWMDCGRVVMDGPAKLVTEAYQKSVEQADEAELAAKFGVVENKQRRPSAGALDGFLIRQGSEEVIGSARALVPLDIEVSGRLHEVQSAADVLLSIVRVDGRHLAGLRLRDSGAALPAQGSFVLRASLDPPILSAGLYRFEVALLDEFGQVDIAARVLELTDEQGQFGGEPLLYYPPTITSKRIGDLA